MTPDKMTIDNLGLPKTEEVVRFWEDARTATITMMDSSQLFYVLPEELQAAIASSYAMGYIAARKESWKSW